MAIQMNFDKYVVYVLNVIELYVHVLSKGLLLMGIYVPDVENFFQFGK